MKSYKKVECLLLIGFRNFVRIMKRGVEIEICVGQSNIDKFVFIQLKQMNQFSLTLSKAYPYYVRTALKGKRAIFPIDEMHALKSI